MRAKSCPWQLGVVVMLSGWSAAALAVANPTCSNALGAPAITRGPLKTVGREPAVTQVTLAAGHTYLVQVEERDNDARIEVLDSKSRAIARADHPERRTGTRRAVVTAPDSSVLLVRVTGKEPPGVIGSASVALFDLAILEQRPDCLAILKALAEADAAYADGEDLSSARSNPVPDGHEAFLHAARAYSSAEQSLGVSGDRPLRGQTDLALAALEYLYLQDWPQTARWAEAASKLLAPEDPYRNARAEALLAAAWIEIGSTAPRGNAVPDPGAAEEEPLVRARHLLQKLVDFHLQRGERYDAGLQLTNISITYLNEGKFQECVGAAAESSRLFGAINERPRRAQAWQNRALCLWGLGHLPEAQRWFERALADIGPDAYPSIYVAALTNTALADYALGHLDESLRLYDIALDFSEKAHAPRDTAYCLYGIGVNYYALGDRQRAREFLERSLAIRTAALDGRGRMATLRALATIDAEQGRVQEALAADQEALALAIAPPTVARIKIQQAAHTASAGRPAEARAMLDQVLATAAMSDPLLQAEARLQRALVLRSMGRPQEALVDLEAARPVLHLSGSIIEEFEVDLELARALRDVGRADASLAAVERALGQADAVRLQTANPELRAQLQTPLRPAYDLKLELLRDRYEQALAAGREAEANALAALAFATADASRAHSFADLASQKFPPAVRVELAAQLGRREELYRELSSRRFALDARLERGGTDDPLARELMADIAELRREVDTINTAIANRVASGGAAVRGGHERARLPAVGADTALVSYWLGSGSAYAWVVLQAEIHWTRLGSPIAIASQAIAFHRSLTRLVDVPVERRLQASAALSTMIVRPLAAFVGGAHKWVIIPDGALDYVPFAALQSGDGAQQSFVALQHDVAVTPAAWMLNVAHSRPSREKILLVADPVYQADDPRVAALKYAPVAAVSESRPAFAPLRREFRRLPSTAREAAGIAALFPPADVVELIGVDATREQLLALDWSQYRFIHIAAHGVADAQVPALSALILGSYDSHGEVQDRDVRVADMALQRLTAEVVVLSACETALGTQIRSEGLVGMSSTMLARGAHAVVASLWPVPDQIGAQLMTQFYQHMLKDSMDPQAALSAAMRSIAAREPSADPALWAGFQISVSTVSALGVTPPDRRPSAAKEASPTTL